VSDLDKGLGKLQLRILRRLAGCGGLSCSDLARLLGLKSSRVYACLKALERRGLVDSFPYYIEYYGWKRVHLQPTRIYRLTEAGKQLLGKFEGASSSVKALPRLSIRLDEFRRWGLEGARLAERAGRLPPVGSATAESRKGNGQKRPLKNLKPA